MPNEESLVAHKQSRYHMLRKPPPMAMQILQALARLWPKKVGNQGISKNEVRAEVERVNGGRIGAVDDVVRSLLNVGVLVVSLDSGADVYYIDSVRAVYIANLLRSDTRDGYSDPTMTQIEQRRRELKNELIASRTKESSTDTDSSDAETFQRGWDDLARDLHRLEVDMRLFSERSRVPSGS